jgi:hypothetical protein
MTIQRYSVTPHSIETILAWVKSKEIAIPEIQRPFVWDASDVRDLLDSLYNGFPVGYLVTWRNPTVKLKDGTLSAGKRILIDGQQRVTALMAALLGQEVLTKDYRNVRIRIAFQPIEEKFEVSNPAIEKDGTWFADIRDIYSPETSLFDLLDKYSERNPDADRRQVSKILEKLRMVTNNHVGVIELADDLDIETVTEIFIRVNSAGVSLSQADFAMSKIAVNEIYGGNVLRKAIDYFCHMAITPDFYNSILHNDKVFASSEYFSQMAWLRKENDEIYDPSYTDMLRVAFATQFRRGKLQDLVALLSGRNFETRQFEEAIVENSFNELKVSVMRFMNETHFKRFVMIIRSAGFVDASLIGSQNALNMAYILYLVLREQKIPDADIERYVRRWFVMSVLTGRYSGNVESTIDYDIRQINSQGIQAYASGIEQGELSDAFWETNLPQAMDTSSGSSPYLRVFFAAQVKLNDRGFLSRDISVRELIEIKSDVHHLFPKDYLKKMGMTRGQYNQIANYALAQSEINITIGNKEPSLYFQELLDQCNGGKKRYGNIVNILDLHKNFEMNAIPIDVKHLTSNEYPDFLIERRKLMAIKIHKYFDGL